MVRLIDGFQPASAFVCVDVSVGDLGAREPVDEQAHVTVDPIGSPLQGFDLDDLEADLFGEGCEGGTTYPREAAATPGQYSTGERRFAAEEAVCVRVLVEEEETTSGA